MESTTTAGTGVLPYGDFASAQVTVLPAESDGRRVTLYARTVPPFVAAALERLYQHLYASLTKFSIDGVLGNAGTYVVRQGEKEVTLYLFRRQQNRVEVLNEMIRLDTEDVQRFAASVFAAFEQVDVISFRAVQTDIRQLPYPYQRFNATENIVLTLPASEQEYFASLGHATRKTIKYYTNKLKRSYPSFAYHTYDSTAATEQQIRTIIDLNRARMAGKKRVSAIDDQELERKIRLVRECGLVGVATIDGRICAGAISYRIGDNYFMDVSAHDGAYDDYRLGTLCCYLTICECIARGGNECHLLWGNLEYKSRFHGVPHNLDHLVVYRARTDVLWNADIALKTALAGMLRQTRQWLLAHREHPLLRLAAGAVNCWRSLKTVAGWRQS
jgi:hypothetical protein